VAEESPGPPFQGPRALKVVGEDGAKRELRLDGPSRPQMEGSSAAASRPRGPHQRQRKRRTPRLAAAAPKGIDAE